MELTLPELSLSTKQVGSKNSYRLSIEPRKIINFDEIIENKGYSLIHAGEVQYCFVRDNNTVPEGFEYVIHCDKQVTVNSFDSVKLKEWLKHPNKIHHTPEEVRESWRDKFHFKEEDTSNEVLGLRVPQISALYAILSHIKVSSQMATVVMPTGTGKTETMLSVLAVERCEKLLVIVPSDALRNQLAEKFITFGLLKAFGILDKDVLNPIVGILNQGVSALNDLFDIIDNSNVIVTTMSIMDGYNSDDLLQIAERFTHVFVDEAHHAKATSWERVLSKFNKAKVVQFTATPFRQDGKALNGKVIFNFSLKMAQDQGYFKPIDFLPIREYNLRKADKVIAHTAMARLRKDMANGHNHILMARCATKSKAEEVFRIYAEFTDLNPILVHSSIRDKKAILNAIINLEHKVIVAVNMLGEGFDLPHLKIAAFHDIRKSLPITLQFAGRFTRSSLDNQLGTASFVANIADVTVEEELSDLYARDANWNSLLAAYSTDATSEEMEFYEFIHEFRDLANSQIPFQNIRFAMSAMVYRNISENSIAYFDRFEQGLQRFKECEYHFSDYNEANQTLVIITADKVNIDWVNYKDIYGLNWRLMVLHYNVEEKLLFIHDSNRDDNFDKLAEAILVAPLHIKKIDVFRVLDGINRLQLQNVGLKEFLSKSIRFTMRSGSDIEEAIADSTLRSTEKSFVSGTGYKEGDKVTIGCSFKGRIWSKRRGNIKNFVTWCEEMSNSLNDESIDPNQVLKATLQPKEINSLPDNVPIMIDWDEEIYTDYSESHVYLEIDNQSINLSECSINLGNCSNNEILFEIETPSHNVKFKQTIIVEELDEQTQSRYLITKISTNQAHFKLKTKKVDLASYFNDSPPAVWYADGSRLTGNEYTTIEQIMTPYPVEKLIARDWAGVDIGKESQHVEPLIIDSIQYKVINDLKAKDFDIIYDDDGSGEIADVVAIRDEESRIYIQLHHLKYAKDGRISARIDNFYEVCGQAQKSVIWRQKKGSDFFNHLLRRQTKVRLGQSRSRIEKGSVEKLESLMSMANRKPIKFEIFIVQPSLSIDNPPEDTLRLLAVTEKYLKETANIDLNVIVNK